ncbi:hypothetical protein KCP75_00745 [Salmonella enterica subsp. enterica]|nr:hypothetical protein KCP75_00745 [Salmonella enterica subsp. enterica]
MWKDAPGKIINQRGPGAAIILVLASSTCWLVVKSACGGFATGDGGGDLCYYE